MIDRITSSESWVSSGQESDPANALFTPLFSSSHKNPTIPLLQAWLSAGRRTNTISPPIKKTLCLQLPTDSTVPLFVFPLAAGCCRGARLISSPASPWPAARCAAPRWTPTILHAPPAACQSSPWGSTRHPLLLCPAACWCPCPKRTPTLMDQTHTHTHTQTRMSLLFNHKMSTAETCSFKDTVRDSGEKLWIFEATIFVRTQDFLWVNTLNGQILACCWGGSRNSQLRLQKPYMWCWWSCVQERKNIVDTFLGVLNRSVRAVYPSKRRGSESVHYKNAASYHVRCTYTKSCGGLLYTLVNKVHRCRHSSSARHWKFVGYN